MELLRVLLPGPLRRDIVHGQLECDLLTITRSDGDPVRVLVGDLPSGELCVERGKLLDVRRVECDDCKVSCRSHGAIVPPPSDSFRAGPEQRPPLAMSRSAACAEGNGAG